MTSPDKSAAASGCESESRSGRVFFELYCWAGSIMSAILAVVLLFAFVVRMYPVKGRSMLDTLHDGERLVVSRLFYTPSRGDIVILFKDGLEDAYDSETGMYSPLVKRVIAIAGDTVEYDSENGRMLVNGAALDEPYILQPMRRMGDMDGRKTVPAGCVFVMGDNRNDSLDSRYSRVGFVDEREILGRTLFRLVPLSKFGAVK